MPPCPDCSPRKLCKNCVLKALNQYENGHVARSMIAKKAGWKIYPEICHLHGLCDHDVKTRRCIACDPEHHPNARSAARAVGAKDYLSRCETHGLTPHGVNTGRCLTCFTLSGAKRVGPPELGARAVARRAGLKTYVSPCEACGVDRDHSVSLGRCLTCFTTGGVTRLAPPAPAVAMLSWQLGVELLNRQIEAPDFGRRLGVAPAMVTRWLTGVTPIPPWVPLALTGLKE